MNERANTSSFHDLEQVFIAKFISILITLVVFFMASASAQQNVVTAVDELEQYEALEEYIDTEYGELLYNEASVATRLEILELLSKDTPSVLVFLHGLSMGLGIDDILEAAVRYEPEKARDFGQSAISLLPLLSDSQDYTYLGYELEDLELDEDTELYLIEDVATRFFEDRQTLEPRPDWQDGQYHFLASVAELKKLQENSADTDWYRDREISLPKNLDNRPIFVSLYESDKSILIDGEEQLLSANDDESFPVVFIFNRQRERSIDELVEEQDYPMTIEGVKQAYSEYALMVTPVPEWGLGEYHIQAEMEEVVELFDIPKEDDFEPEHWQKLLDQAEEYKKTEPAFLIVILTGDEDEVVINSHQGQQYAVYSDPRDAEEYPYVRADDGDDTDNLSLPALFSQGLVLNRPDLIAALIAKKVTRIPIAFYYIDNARTKPYTYGPRALRLFITGLPTPILRGGGGGFGPPPACASPPCNDQ